MLIINLKIQKLISKFMQVPSVRRSVYHLKKIRCELESYLSNQELRPPRATSLRAFKKRSPEVATKIEDHPTIISAYSVLSE